MQPESLRCLHPGSVSGSHKPGQTGLRVPCHLLLVVVLALLVLSCSCTSPFSAGLPFTDLTFVQRLHSWTRACPAYLINALLFSFQHMQAVAYSTVHLKQAPSY